MKPEVGGALLEICREIKEYGWSNKKWAKNDDHDFFQYNTIQGGYNADEKAFLFSYYEPEGEWWFRFTLEDIPKLLSGEIKYLKLKVPERW